MLYDNAWYLDKQSRDKLEQISYNCNVYQSTIKYVK